MQPWQRHNVPMTRFKFIILPLFILSALVFMCSPVCQAKTPDSSKKTLASAPVTNGGKKWRVGYLEGGEYKEFSKTMLAIVSGLMDLNWISPQALKVDQKASPRELWDFFSRNLDSDYLEFVADAFYSGQWNEKTRGRLKEEVIQRLNQEQDLDLMFAAGTWAGVDLSQGDHGTPVIVLASTDPLTADIIKSVEDSGNDQIFARVDPTRYERQFTAFKDLIGFKSLGVVFMDTMEGRSYAVLNVAQKVGREMGFAMETCALKPTDNLVDEERQFLSCFRQLTDRSDAIYVVGQRSVNDRTLREIARVAIEQRIPTFSQSGSDEVEKGLLMSFSQAGFKAVGRFYAQALTRILNGAKPRELDQVFVDPSRLAINLDTAEAIGYYPSLDELSAADVIYRRPTTTFK